MIDSPCCQGEKVTGKCSAPVLPFELGAWSRGSLSVPNTRQKLSESPGAIDSPIPAIMDNPMRMQAAIIRMNRWVWLNPHSRNIKARASKKIKAVNEPKALMTFLPTQCFTPGMPVIRSQTQNGHHMPHPSILGVTFVVPIADILTPGGRASKRKAQGLGRC